MDSYFAVFNVDKPDLSKARVAFNKRFGPGSYRRHISSFVRQGIMSIFSAKPTRYTKWYVDCVTTLVNDRLKAEKERDLRGIG